MAAESGKQKQKRTMVWTDEHDIVFLREVLTERPYRYNKGSKESVNSWLKIEATLTNNRELRFFVSSKSLRDHLNYILRKQNKTLRISLGRHT